MNVTRTPCQCGCGGIPKGLRSRFLPGHDARVSAETDIPRSSVSRTSTSYHIGVAAEAIAAAQFARCGFDVSVQYGANQPEYDLIVAKRDRLLKVSVKGSQDGSWGLTQSYLKQADYHGAIQDWLTRHGSTTVFCFVQFKNVGLDALPRLYLASPADVAQRLRETAKGRGDTILYEQHAWGARAAGAGTTERLPDNWRFSIERIEELLAPKPVSATLAMSVGNNS
jgi:Holliday junction resolvase-like predicted endonuclease